RLYVDTHILAALHEQRLVDQIAQRIFLALFDILAQLLGRAFALAFLFGVLFGGHACFIEVGTGNDLVVDAGDDFFDGLGIGAFGRRFLLSFFHRRLLYRGGLLFCWLRSGHPRLFQRRRSLWLGRVLRRALRRACTGNRGGEG